MSCRNDAGAWSPPAFLRLTGGSVGLQIGAEKSDIVLFFMTERGAKSLLESKFTLGGKVSVAAGPVGRTGAASTDLRLDAEIYSYAKRKGLFAGIRSKARGSALTTRRSPRTTARRSRSRTCCSGTARRACRTPPRRSRSRCPDGGATPDRTAVRRPSTRRASRSRPPGTRSSTAASSRPACRCRPWS